MCGDAPHVPLHLITSVLLLDGVLGQALVLLQVGVEGLVATDARRHSFQLEVVPLLGEDLLHLGPRAAAEGHAVDVGTSCTHEDAVSQASVRGLAVVAVNTELVVGVCY